MERADGVPPGVMSGVATAPGREVGEAPLRFDRVSKTFEDGTRALTSVSLSVMPGEFVSVVGPSGCGKSTLLRIASGLTEATSGRVDVAPGNLGYVFQDATLLPWRTVRRNVELFCELRGVPKKERRALGQEAIDLVGLTGFEKHYPLSLSGGMKMRASLARSLTLNPAVFLFDEPFGAIDEITRDRLNIELMRLFELERFAALFITHSINEAVYLSTRVMVMSARPGRIVATYDVPFPYPRSEDLRYQPEFAALTGAISHALREAHT
jgi:NitT/TauT family transport system ATP-binding protein